MTGRRLGGLAWAIPVAIVAGGLGGASGLAAQELLRRQGPAAGARAAAASSLAARPSPCPSLERLIHDGHLDATAAVDPWGRRYGVRCREGGVRVHSAGPDGVFETTDDVEAPAE